MTPLALTPIAQMPRLLALWPRQRVERAACVHLIAPSLCDGCNTALRGAQCKQHHTRDAALCICIYKKGERGRRERVHAECDTSLCKSRR
jgi:hypothetical protein